MVVEKLKIDKLVSDRLKLEDVSIEIGKVEEYWDEPMGPTPKPSIADLRDWDFKLLSRYEPFYSPICDMCCMCTFGKCDLSKGKRGACGIDIATQQARFNTMLCCIGAACHGGHARDLLEHLIEKLGRDFPIDFGPEVEIEAPIVRTVVGIKPKTLGDLEEAMAYGEEQLTQVLSAVHIGQEGSNLDFESKQLHISMIDNLVKEIADIVQIVAYNFPKGDPNAPLVDIGLGTIDRDKPVILCIGHNVIPAEGIVRYLEANKLENDVEICGICCTAIDITRKSTKAKVVGPFTQQMKFVRSGVADVIIVDEQCIRTNILEEAQKVKAPLIATNDKMCLGLKDRTHDDVEDIVTDLVTEKEPGALIFDPEKVGEVAVKVAQFVERKRRDIKLPELKELREEANRCVDCKSCQRECPVNLDVPRAVDGASKGNFELLVELHERCLGCLKCESACERGIPIVSMMQKAYEKKIKEEKFKLRSGRGPILDTEIRNVGAPIVLGEIPGVVAFAGCTNYPNGGIEVAEMAEEFLKRNYIVVASGCAAMDIATYKDEEGKTLYEKYPGDFDTGCLVNVGSCVSNAHIVGAAIKIAAIFARRNLRANFEEIADYILNRVGAVGVVWGAMSQKALSIGTGIMRWGIPIVTGPQGSKYRRLYLGRKDKPEKWKIYDARTGGELIAEPAPEHLGYVVESKEEAMVAVAKLCIRPNDTTKGRQIKLSHYVDLHERLFGTMPSDIELFVRTEADIPLTKKEEIKRILKEKGWRPRTTPDPTLLKRLIRAKKS